ncbi:baseplate J/gp47 family protein [Sulfuriflexus mobilis]|uniref:baseplate J/gp47 family protein n=1 Tax=Sulfuriflexus mobilis TaxID=1811807 RepID=UPI000F8374A1|nr:baseplate J/gp47 family protein [Sulfuriflexus mobilis]
MPFARADLATLIDRRQADVESRLPGTDPKLRRKLLTAVVRSESSSAHLLHGHLDWIANQILVDTAEEEILERHASLWLKNGRKAAAKSGGNITVTGTDGKVILAGTIWQRSDGAEFSADAEATIAAGSATVAVTASESGTEGNTAAGSKLNLVETADGVNSAATVDVDGLTGGTDIENGDSLRARVIARKQQAPHGGASFDYVTWVLEVPGVTRAWVYPQELGLGTVTVRFMMDDTYADGIPLAADVTAVQDYVDAVRPVTAGLTVVAPVAVPLNFNITGLSPNTAAVKLAIEAELKDLVAREAVPGGTILLSHVREAISIASGEADHVLVSPAVDVTHTTGQIATFGVITW